MAKLEEKSIIEKNIKDWHIPMPEQDYMVVVQCSTYNHEKYIEDALKGFVMQQTNFPWCVLVTDDCSTDGTASIIKKYADKYPAIIKPILLGYNHMQHQIDRGPYIYPWHNRAKYLAICEGDDYWTDPLKLQKQVDFLEAHEDYGLCYSKAKIWIEEKKVFSIDIQGDNTDFIKLLKGYNTIPSASVLYRQSLYREYELAVNLSKRRWRMGDYPMVLYFSSKFEIHGLPDITTVYRVLLNSASNSTDPQRLLPYFKSILEIKLYFIVLNKINDVDLIKFIYRQHFELMEEKYHSIKYCFMLPLKKYPMKIKLIGIFSLSQYLIVCLKRWLKKYHSISLKESY